MAKFSQPAHTHNLTRDIQVVNIEGRWIGCRCTNINVWIVAKSLF